MECMCPSCGKKIKKGMLSFNLNEFIRSRLSQEIDKLIEDEDEKTIVSEGCNVYFNYWNNQQKPLRVSEESLWKYPVINTGADQKDSRTVSFIIPVRTIVDKIKVDPCTDGDKEALEQFVKWMEASRKQIESKTFPLRLRKSGDGDVWFDEIYFGSEVVANERICPECASTMSFFAGRYPEWTLTVLGGPRVSKSTALTACAAAFMNDNDPFINWEISESDVSSRFFEENYLNEYNAGRKLKATETEKDKIPRISFRVRIGKRNAQRKQYICLTFVDLPGEFNSEKGVASSTIEERYKNIFENIDFVWYCTDPGELQQLEGNIVSEDLGYEEREVIKTPRIKDNMRRLSGYFAHSKRKVPVAYILGKIDSSALLPEDNKKYKLYNAEKDELKLPFNVRTFYRRSANVKQYMMDKNIGGLVEEFENMFPERCYIATTAYGYNPKKVDERETRETKPYHCKDAFYWMLALRNCVDVEVEYYVSKFWGRKLEQSICKLGDLDDDVRDKAYHNLYMQGNYMV